MIDRRLPDFIVEEYVGIVLAFYLEKRLEYMEQSIKLRWKFTESRDDNIVATWPLIGCLIIC